MKRGEVYRTKERIAERGDKPGFYVVVSRSFIAANTDKRVLREAKIDRLLT